MTIYVSFLTFLLGIYCFFSISTTIGTIFVLSLQAEIYV